MFVPRRSTLREQRLASGEDFDVLPAALVELDASGQILRVDRAARRLLGTPPPTSRARPSRVWGLVLDDFGTGYSSLSHLKRFPIDRVKVDRMFVDEVARDAGSRAIAAAVVRVAGGFGAPVVAEGVERAEQVRHVRELGCRDGQGHDFVRDLTGGEAEALLVAQRAAALRPR